MTAKLIVDIGVIGLGVSFALFIAVHAVARFRERSWLPLADRIALLVGHVLLLLAVGGVTYFALRMVADYFAH